MSEEYQQTERIMDELKEKQHSPYHSRAERRVRALEDSATARRHIAEALAHLGRMAEAYLHLDLDSVGHGYEDAARGLWEWAFITARAPSPVLAALHADQMLQQWKRRYKEGVNVDTGKTSTEELHSGGQAEDSL